jgi:putative ABC transport system permease protein
MMEGKMDESLLMQTAWVDYDFLDTYKMTMSEGRFFDRSYPADEQTCVVNESMAREYQLDEPTSKVILSPDDMEGNFTSLPIIGVVNDFSFESLSRPIDPYILIFKTEQYQFGFVTVRIEEENMNHTIQEIEKIWQEFTTNDPMPYFFVDEDFERFVKQEKNSAKLAVIFAILAILVASLGLLGLTSFMLEQRTKEIGIRKAMGGTVGAVFTLISKNVLLLITIAAFIGIPAIYFVANRWLQGYHFRINPGFLDFFSGYMLAIFIALITISWRTLRAARVSPAQSLKHQ